MHRKRAWHNLSPLERAAEHLKFVRLLANDGPAGAFHPQEDGGFIHTIDLRRFISYVLTDLLEAEASPESVGTSHQELRRLLTGKQMPVHAKPRMKRRKKAVAPIPCTPVPGIRFHAEHAL